MFPIEDMAKPTFIGGYGSAIISFEWDSSLIFRPTHERYPPPVAKFRAEACPRDMEITTGRISPLGSVIVGNLVTVTLVIGRWVSERPAQR